MDKIDTKNSGKIKSNNFFHPEDRRTILNWEAIEKIQHLLGHQNSFVYKKCRKEIKSDNFTHSEDGRTIINWEAIEKIQHLVEHQKLFCILEHQ